MVENHTTFEISENVATQVLKAEQWGLLKGYISIEFELDEHEDASDNEEDLSDYF